MDQQAMTQRSDEGDGTIESAVVDLVRRLIENDARLDPTTEPVEVILDIEIGGIRYLAVRCGPRVSFLRPSRRQCPTPCPVRSGRRSISVRVNLRSPAWWPWDTPIRPSLRSWISARGRFPHICDASSRSLTSHPEPQWWPASWITSGAVHNSTPVPTGLGMSPETQIRRLGRPNICPTCSDHLMDTRCRRYRPASFALAPRPSILDRVQTYRDLIERLGAENFRPCRLTCSFAGHGRTDVIARS